jgi:hypothetical protein
MTAAVARQMLNLLRTMSSSFCTYGQLQANSVAATNSPISNATLIPISPLVAGAASNSSNNSAVGVTNTPHYMWLANMDTTTNYIRILDGNQSSAVVAEVAPGDIGMIPLWGACKPYAYSPAPSQQPYLEYFIMGY